MLEGASVCARHVEKPAACIQHGRAEQCRERHQFETYAMSTTQDQSEILDEFRQIVQELRDDVSDLRHEVEGLRDEVSGAPSLLDRDEAAERLGISVRVLDTLEAKGEIQAIRPNGEGGRVLYPPQSLELYVERNRRGGDRS